MRVTAKIVLLLASSAMVGCTAFTTSLSSTKVGKVTTPGLTYRLPARQFSLTTTYQVTGCNVVGSKISLEADVKAVLSERLIGAEAYTISYRDLDALTKVTNTELRISEAGLLTGINAGVVDQSGVVIQNTVGMAAGIARAVALPAASKAADVTYKLNQLLAEKQLAKAAEQLQAIKMQTQAAGTEWAFPPAGKPLTEDALRKELADWVAVAPKPSCKEISELVQAQKDAEDELKAEKTRDKDRTIARRKKDDAEAEIARLSALKDVYEALGREEDKKGLMTRIKEQEARQVLASSDLDRLGVSGTEKATETLTKATAALTITATKDVVPDKSGSSYSVSVTENQLPESLRKSKSITVNAAELPKVTLIVDELIAASGGALPRADDIGVAYRIPVAAIARVQCDCADGKRILIEQLTQVPQFGPIGLIDLKNGAFANNNLEVVFNGSTGAPEKLSFHSQSRAEAASAAARDAGNAYLQLQKDKRDDVLAANKAAIDQQTALLALAKTRTDVSLADAQASAAAALLPVTTEKSMVTAQIDLLRDQQRLDAVRTGTASAAEVQLEALVNQQKLLEQQLKILQVEQQIAEQKAKAQAGTTP